MFRTSSYSATGVSLVLHLALLIALWAIPRDLFSDAEEVELETVFTKERVQEEFTQELEMDSRVSETLSLVAGAQSLQAESTTTSTAQAAQKISQSRALQKVDLTIPTAPISVPVAGADFIGNLEFGELQGESTAVVSGYDAAMSRITAEIMRLMRKKPVLVVWMFDESESMRDDQREIRDKFHKVYEELGIGIKQVEAERQGRRGAKVEHILTTQISSFGEGLHALTSKPTANINEIKAAIDKIPIDETGKENFFQALAAVMKKYLPYARREDRQLAVIVVSDESGDDAAALEDSVEEAKRASAPVYILGRESMFGYPWARIRWVDPTYGLPHWPRIRRGPETPYPEALQFNGLHERWRNYNAGFGPYAQVRLAKETGGIFFVLPGEESALNGRVEDNQRKYHSYDMKEYEPQLVSRKDYVEKIRNPHKFRKQLALVIKELSPFVHKNLNMKVNWYPIQQQEFIKVARGEFDKTRFAMKQLDTAVKILEDIQPLREEEPSQRWRANFDLIYAQCLSYRVRLFQFQLALDGFMESYPKVENPNLPPPRGVEPKRGQKVDYWDLRYRQKLLEPTERQIKLTKIDLEKLKEHDRKARELYKQVSVDHPRTPWAHIADEELRTGFGVEFVKVSRSAFYNSAKIKVPNF
jgi:hypothetical protein